MRSWEGFEEVVAIADAGTFVRAAAMLGVSTSHVSRVVARLEARLDAHLFHRTTRHVSLTDTGRAFVEHSRRIIRERDELLSQASGSGEPQGELRMTCPTSLGERFIAPLVRQFTDDHPRLSIFLDLTNRVVDLVGEGYDLAIRTGRTSDSRLTACQIASRRIVVCAAPAYLRTAGVPQTIRDLEGHRCLIGTNPNWHFLDNHLPCTFKPVGRWHCNSGAAIVDAAVAGMGICQLPAFYVRQPVASGRLTLLLTAFETEPEPIWVVYPNRRHFLPKIRQLVDMLTARFQHAIDMEPDPSNAISRPGSGETMDGR